MMSGCGKPVFLYDGMWSCLNIKKSESSDTIIFTNIITLSTKPFMKQASVKTVCS